MRDDLAGHPGCRSLPVRVPLTTRGADGVVLPAKALALFGDSGGNDVNEDDDRDAYPFVPGHPASDGIDSALFDVLWPVHNGLLRSSGSTCRVLRRSGKLSPILPREGSSKRSC